MDSLIEKQVQNEILKALDNLSKTPIIVPSGSSEDIIAIAALCAKSISHASNALELVVSASNSESMILLRSAYEATVIALYLNDFPKEFKVYKAFSELTILRNQLEVLALAKSDMTNTDIQDQQDRCAKQRENIIKHEFHKEFKLLPDDLKDLKSLQKVTNKSHFKQFRQLKESIKPTKLTSALLLTGFQTYNLGSQIAHSHYEMTVSYFIHVRDHPACSIHAIYRQIIFILFNNINLLEKTQCIKASAIKKDLLGICSLFMHTI